MVLENLWKWEDRFDCETSVAEKGDVNWRARDEWEENVYGEEGRCQVGEELVVAVRVSSASNTQLQRLVLTGAHWPIARSRRAADPTAATAMSRLQSSR